jgi:hypothetical protein
VLQCNIDKANSSTETKLEFTLQLGAETATHEIVRYENMLRRYVDHVNNNPQTGFGTLRIVRRRR